MAERRKPTKRELKEAKKLLHEDGYPIQYNNADGHLVAKNTQWGMSVTVSLKDGSNLVEHVIQQITRNLKEHLFKVGFVEKQKELREQYPAYSDLTITPKSTKLKRFVDKKGDYTGTKGKVYYKMNCVIEYKKED
tara:strand:+ start:2598 stop:3002 length:405 start_codon:yes stop_codon:yes gene_type:complete